MLNRIRDRFGTAGLVVSIMALVLALAGGAFAASGGLNAKQKKQVKAIAKSLVPTGPVGAAGPAGPAGANGAAGAAGANGKTVLSGTATPGAGVGAIGDFYMDTDDSIMYGPKAASGANGGWGTGTALKGATGDPWTAGGTLPKNATETGALGLMATVAGSPDIGLGENNQFVPISFPIPLSGTLDKFHAIYVPPANTTTAHCSAAAPNGPGGTPKNPKADSGYLCVYDGGTQNAEPSPNLIAFFGTPFWDPHNGVLSGQPPVDQSGTNLVLKITGDAALVGSWAVTG